MIIYFLIGVFFTSILGFFYPKLLLFSSIFSLFTILYFYLQNRKNKQKEKIFKPKSQSYKPLSFKINLGKNHKILDIINNYKMEKENLCKPHLMHL